MDDRSIKARVEAELDWEPSIDSADVGITVEQGIVRLTGRVANYAQKVAAEAAVKRVKGVRGYSEALDMRATPGVYSDEAIAGRIANVLDWSVSVPPGSVQVKVEKGFVTLMGTVDWQYQRKAAERLVRSQLGVHGIGNEIAIKSRIQAIDIKRRIEDALKRQADFDADRIRISVEGSKVRLDGTVRAWSERDTIERAVWSAPGVARVEDHIAIGL